MWIKLSKAAPVRYLNLALLAEVTVEDTPAGPVVRAKAPLRHLTFTGADAVALLDALDDVVAWESDVDGDEADGTPANGAAT